MEILVCHKILERGYDYYAEGRTYGSEVPGRKRAGQNTYRYSVFGHTMYHVQIVVGRDSIESLNCDCPYAQEGHYCKHMAAALYDMESEGRLEITETTSEKSMKTREAMRLVDKQVFPFRNENQEQLGENPYQYYNLDKITEGIFIGENTLKEAKELIEKARVKLKSLREGFLNTYSYGELKVCIAEGTYLDNEGRESNLQVRFSRDVFVSNACGVMGCENFSFFQINIIICHTMRITRNLTKPPAYITQN